MRKRILYHKTEMSCHDRSTMQLVPPELFRKQVLQVEGSFLLARDDHRCNQAYQTMQEMSQI